MAVLHCLATAYKDNNKAMQHCKTMSILLLKNLDLGGCMACHSSQKHQSTYVASCNYKNEEIKTNLWNLVPMWHCCC